MFSKPHLHNLVKYSKNQKGNNNSTNNSENIRNPNRNNNNKKSNPTNNNIDKDKSETKQDIRQTNTQQSDPINKPSNTNNNNNEPKNDKKSGAKEGIGQTNTIDKSTTEPNDNTIDKSTITSKIKNLSNNNDKLKILNKPDFKEDIEQQKPEHSIPVAIKFTHLTTSGYIIIIPAFLCIAVSDLFNTFDDNPCDIGYAFPIVSSYMIIGAIPIVQLLYEYNVKPFHVFNKDKSRLGEICVKHFGLLVAFVGVIITDFAIMTGLWSDCSAKWFLQIPHLITSITNIIIVLYLEMAVIEENNLPNIMNR